MSKMTKNQMEAAEAYYKATHEEKDFLSLTNGQVAEMLTKRLDFKVSETAARNIRVNLGLPTKKQVIIKHFANGDINDAVKILAKTQSELTHIVISMLNRSSGYNQTTKESMFYNLNSIEQQTKEIVKSSTKKRKPCILGPRGTALKIAKDLRANGKNNQEIIQALKDKYIEAGVKKSIALSRAETLVNHSLDKK